MNVRGLMMNSSFDLMIPAFLLPDENKWFCRAEAAADDAGGGGGSDADADGNDATSSAAAAAAAASAAGSADAASAADAGNKDGANVVWPENWREEFAGGDAKVAEELGRYAEPGMIGPALVEAKNKIRSNTAREPLADNATDEEVVTWREQNGIPTEPDGYLEGLPDGLVIGEEDKAGMETLTAAMHGVNAPPAVVHAAMGAYYTHIENALAAQADADALAKKNSDDALNEAYGSEFRRNMNDLEAWLGAAGGDVKASVMGSRMQDGSPLGSNPEYVQWMIGQMRLINPLVTVPGLGGGDPAAALDDEIAAIEKVISTDKRTYDGDQKMQDRYLELLDARGKRK